MVSNCARTVWCGFGAILPFRFAALALATWAILFSGVPNGWAQALQDDIHVQYKFNGLADGAGPVGSLLADGYKHVIGVAGVGTQPCVTTGCGVIYGWAGGYLDTHFTFGSLLSRPNYPLSGVVRDAAGNLYGEMSLGANTSTFGAIYKVTPSGKATILHRFSEEEGFPVGGLLLDSAGNLYGNTQGLCSPGAGCGEIFKVGPTGNTTILYVFSNDGLLGSSPGSQLVMDEDGNLYGTALYGGPPDYVSYSTIRWGVLFKLGTDGTLTALHNFTGGSDGAYPNGIIRDDQGNIYGFAGSGGNESACAVNNFPNGCGVVYKYDKYGNFSALYTFTGLDGAIPQGVPLLIGDTVYGATQAGGYYSLGHDCYDGCGVVFQVTQEGTETLLHIFTGKDGIAPSTGLIQLPDGDIYGATQFGGHSSVSTNPCSNSGTVGCGVLYKILLPQ